MTTWTAKSAGLTSSSLAWEWTRAATSYCSAPVRHRSRRSESPIGSERSRREHQRLHDVDLLRRLQEIKQQVLGLVALEFHVIGLAHGDREFCRACPRL